MVSVFFFLEFFFYKLHFLSFYLVSHPTFPCLRVILGGKESPGKKEISAVPHRGPLEGRRVSTCAEEYFLSCSSGRFSRERQELIVFFGSSFWDAARTLNGEAKLNNTFIVCDNIDLSTILKEYETYYQMKFGKAPRLCRRRDPAEMPKQASTANSKIARKVSKTSTPNPAVTGQEA